MSKQNLKAGDIVYDIFKPINQSDITFSMINGKIFQVNSVNESGYCSLKTKKEGSDKHITLPSKELRLATQCERQKYFNGIYE